MKKLTFKNLNIIVMLGLIGLAIICVYSYAESWVLSSEALLIGNLNRDRHAGRFVHSTQTRATQYS